MIHKVLCILGPTSIGKTALSLHFAEKFGGDVLVADSRQVYKDMDVVTGKDLQSNFQFSIFNFQSVKMGCWVTPAGVRIWLTDLVEPDEEFSVAHWNKCAIKVIEYLSLNNKLQTFGYKLPILAVGTGLYLKSLEGGIETLNIPPIAKLRESLENKTAQELFSLLTRLNSVKAKNMNGSDRKNKRRLIRAIEVVLYKKTKELKNERTLHMDLLKIGLTAPKEIVLDRIDKRVDERLKMGSIEETKKLLTEYSDWSSPAFSSVGYRYLREYLLGKKKLDDVVGEWKEAEHAYARRQATWFKKEPNVNWFDITDSGWQQKVEKLVGNWYN